MHRITLSLSSLLLAACAGAPLPEGVECRALTGELLRARALPPAVQAEREALLASAAEAHAEAPDDVAAIVWHGRRLAYLGRYRDAVAVYTEGLRRHPEDPELLRHRGHRWITLREFAAAERDLARAAAVVRGQPDRIEPDGLPVPGRPPHSTLHFNIHYHLGLARHLQGDFAGAAAAWDDCRAVARNDEARAAVAHWQWTARMRNGEPALAAAAVADLGGERDVVENVAYLRLCRLYRGEIGPEAVAGDDGSSAAAAAYGLGNWHLVRGDHAAGAQVWSALRARGEWASFGHIAAEAEAARSR